MANWNNNITVEIRYPIIDHCTLRYVWTNPIVIHCSDTFLSGDSDFLRWFTHIDYGDEKFTICGKASLPLGSLNAHRTNYKVMCCQTRRDKWWRTDPKYTETEKLKIRVLSIN